MHVYFVFSQVQVSVDRYPIWTGGGEGLGLLQPPNEEEPVLAIAAGHKDKMVAAYKNM